MGTISWQGYSVRSAKLSHVSVQLWGPSTRGIPGADLKTTMAGEDAPIVSEPFEDKKP